MRVFLRFALVSSLAALLACLALPSVAQAQQDTDGDGVFDDADNCDDVYNPMQIDIRFEAGFGEPNPSVAGDGIGDACQNYGDADLDGVGDQFEPCPDSPCSFPEDGDTEVNPLDPTDIGDGFGNAVDNCPTVFNPRQGDVDRNGIGDSCDPDFDNSGAINVDDFAAFFSCFGANPADAALSSFGRSCLEMDLFESNSINVNDYSLLFAYINGAPLPISGIRCAGAPCGAPVLHPIGPQPAPVGNTLLLQLIGTDAYEAPLTFSVTPLPLPQNSSFDMGTGLFSFTPGLGQVGSFDLTFSVTDGTKSDSEIVSVTVTAPVQGAPTSFSGRLLDAVAFADDEIEVAVVNARVSVLTLDLQPTGFHTQTDAQGEFTLDTTTDDTPLDQTDNMPFPSGGLIFDIDTMVSAPDNTLLGPDGATYSSFREAISLIAGVAHVVARPFYLTRIDTGSIVTVSPASGGTLQSTGVKIVVPAGAAVKSGAAYSGELSLSMVPLNLAPAALPEALEPALLMTIQPPGVAFVPPLTQVTFPNTDGLPIGSVVDLWSLDAEHGTFVRAGRGIVVDVGGGATEVTFDPTGLPPGTVNGGIRAADWHAILPLECDTEGKNNNDAACDNCQAEVGSRVDISTGNLLVSHSTAAYQSQSQERALRFTYSSERAHPQPIIQNQTTIPAPTALPPKVSASLTVGGASQGVEIFTDTGNPSEGLSETSDETFIQALQFDASSLPTGRYPYQMEITSNYTGGSRITAVTGDFVAVFNESASAFGTGWTLEGLQRLHPQADGSVVVTDGDGTFLHFKPSPALVIGSWDTARGGDRAFANGTEYDLVRAALEESFPGHSFFEFNTLDKTQLQSNGVDVVMLSTVFNSLAPPFDQITPLNADEQQDLHDFVEEGGAALVMGEPGGELPSNSVLNPFGVSSSGAEILTRELLGSFLDLDGSPATGPFGSATSFVQLFPGVLSNLGNYARAIGVNPLGATLAVIDPGAIAAGSGPVFLTSDTMFIDELNFVCPTPPCGSRPAHLPRDEVFFKNVVNYLASQVATNDFAAPQGEFSTLVKNAGGTYTRTLKNGTKINFDAAGFHTSTVDRNLNTTQFVHVNGRLTQIRRSRWEAH